MVVNPQLVEINHCLVYGLLETGDAIARIVDNSNRPY
jgi:hypothetical protein